VLDHPRGETRGFASVLEIRARQRLAHERDLVRGQYVADHDLHAVLDPFGNALE